MINELLKFLSRDVGLKNTSVLSPNKELLFFKHYIFHHRKASKSANATKLKVHLRPEIGKIMKFCDFEYQNQIT